MIDEVINTIFQQLSEQKIWMFWIITLFLSKVVVVF